MTGYIKQEKSMDLLNKPKEFARAGRTHTQEFGPQLLAAEDADEDELTIDSGRDRIPSFPAALCRRLGVFDTVDDAEHLRPDESDLCRKSINVFVV